MDWQTIIVIFIGILVGAIVLYKLYKLFFGKKEEVHQCSGCGGCSQGEKFKNSKVQEGNP